MELKDFVSQTLIQIVEGVPSAQEPTRKLDGAVNPTMEDFSENPNLGHVGTRGYSNDQRVIFPVQFDVSLSTEQSKTKGGEAGLRVSIISAGGKKQSQSSESQVAQVKFIVPVLLPYDTHPFKRREGDSGEIVQNEATRASENY